MTEQTKPARPSLRWLKRKARQIQRLYQVPRRMAIWDAKLQWICCYEPTRLPARKALAIVEATYA
jgi:hypothetical protein